MSLDEAIQHLLGSVTNIVTAWHGDAQSDPNFPVLRGEPQEFVLALIQECVFAQAADIGPDTRWATKVAEWASQRGPTISCRSRELLYLSKAVKSQIPLQADPDSRTVLAERVDHLVYWALELMASRLARALDHAAHRDSLTELRNRAGFEADAKRLLASDCAFSCVSIDMDGLKQINDTQGHEAGDEAIKAMARVLSPMSGPGTCVSRWGGDEFWVLAQGEAAYNLASQLQDLRSESPIKFSFGIATYPSDHEEWTEVKKIADAKMYQQKRTRKRSRHWLWGRVDAFLSLFTRPAKELHNPT